MKNKVVELMPMNFGTPDGKERYSLVGFESDGTVWIQPDDLGIEPEQGNALLDFPQPWLIVDEAHSLVLLHWRAAAELPRAGVLPAALPLRLELAVIRVNFLRC